MAPERLAAGDYGGYGRNIGEIIADVAFINPSDEEVWTLDNSIIVSKGKAEKVPSTFYSTDKVKVEAENPLTKYGNMVKKVVEYKGKTLKYQTNTLKEFVNVKTKLKAGEHDRSIWDRINDFPRPEKKPF